MLGSCDILFQFVNKRFNAGVFFGDSFCPKGFVLLGGLQVYLMGIIFRCTLYTSKYGVRTHNIQKLFSITLWKKWNCAEIVSYCFR